jgi:hypothetical protein
MAFNKAVSAGSFFICLGASEHPLPRNGNDGIILKTLKSINMAEERLLHRVDIFGGAPPSNAHE